MTSTEAEGDTIDAAIDAALAHLGVSRDRVEIEIIANATRGLFGIGARKARVRARLRPPVSVEDRPAPLHDRRTTVTRPPQGETLPPPEPVDEATAERARQVLQDIIGRVGVPAQVMVRTAHDRLVLELVGDSSGVLIGRRGQMLDALEYVVNRIVGRDEGSAARISIDSEDYRARRRSALEELARRMADQAKKKRRQVTLNPMSPRDRRIVHLVLQDDRSLTTRSSGRGYYRRLIIIPEGAGRAARGD